MFKLQHPQDLVSRSFILEYIKELGPDTIKEKLTDGEANFWLYNPRYYAWKSNIDRIHGAFTTTLQDWVAPVDDSFLYSTFGISSSGSFVTWPFFKVNPNTLDNIFAVKADSTWESDQFLVNSYIGCKVVRPLSRDGVPY